MRSDVEDAIVVNDQRVHLRDSGDHSDSLPEA